MTKKGYYIFVIICLSVLYAELVVSQQPSIHSNPQFQHISKGLSQNTITTIIQDQYGFMWFGTRNGLNKYDGVEITQYDRRFNDSISVSHGHVNYIFEDSKGIIWVGTREGGLNWYNRERDEFINVHLEHDPYHLNNASITTMYEDQLGNFWLGTEDHGLILFDRDTKACVGYQHQEKNPFSLSHDNVQKIFEDLLGNLWVATRYQGLNLFDVVNQRFYRYEYNPMEDTGISSNLIRDVLISRNGNIWIATQEGLNLMYRDPLNQVKFKWFKHDLSDTSSISHNVIIALGEDDFGNIWAGTENGGLSIYDPRKQAFQRFYHNPKDPTSVGNNSFWVIYKDRSGVMWLGPLNAGVNKYDPNSIKFTQHTVQPYLQNTLSHNNVTCFLEDKKGNLWVGTDGGGLNYFNRSTNSYIHYKHNPENAESIGSNAILSLTYDSRGRLWIGTWEGGLNLFNPNTNTFTRFTHDPADPASIRSNNIFSVLVDRQDRFWVAASRGALELFDPDKGTFKHFYENDFPTTSIYKIYQDSQDDIWLGSEQGLSLFQWDGQQEASFKHYQYKPGSPDGITARGVINIYEDSKNNFWLGTEGGGLNLFKREEESIVAFTKSDGLPNDVIYAIIEDDQNHLWLSTNKGISKFDPESKTFRNYDHADGLQADEFIRGAYLKTSTGEFVLGGIKGFNTFYPANIKDNRDVADTYFTDFKINNKSVKATDSDSPLQAHINDVSEIVLSHDQSMISFDYVALNFSQGSKNQYQYILEGHDKTWQQVGTTRRASYASLPPGKYVFRVKGSNSDGIWNVTDKSVAVIIRPPWWQSSWAYGLYFLIIVSLLIWSRQLIINRERLKSNLQLEHLELTKMQELDQMKSRFFTNISHEFRTPLTLIKEPLKAMYNGEFIGNSKNQYRVMLRNTQKLLRLINQLLDLSKLGVGSLKLKASKNDLNKFLTIISESFRSQADRQYISFQFIEEAESVMVYFDPIKLEDIICNLLSNAFKFTPGFGQVTMEVAVINRPGEDKKWARISVKDSGIGIPEDQLNNIFDRFYQVNSDHPGAEKGTGIGLALTKELVDLHGGEILIKSEIDHGSEFIVLLPCGTDHLLSEDIVTVPSAEVTEFGELKGLYQEDTRVVVSDNPASMSLILVVEDNPDMRAYITEHLETNHRIMEAANGEEAFEIALKHLPEVIVSDISMPVMGGVALCKKIKQDERLCHIPVILLTGRADEENEIRSLKHGADYYFTKPFNSKLLQMRINNIIQSRTVLRNHFSTNQKIYLEPSKVDLSSADDIFLKEALSIVEENMANPNFTVIEFGKALGLSRMKLYRKLKSITGQSANEFIRTIRLKRAAQLIEQNQLTIAEITYEVGFNDLQYFRECFKKHFNVTPSKYLENLGDNSLKQP